MVNESVSIIIPDLNSPIIDKTISSLFSQTEFRKIEEILVVGVDGPGLVVERGPVRLIPTPTPVTAPVARNIGIRQAKGSYFAFIDSDCVADPSWLAILLAAQVSHGPVVGGSVSFKSSSFWQLCYNLSMFHDFLPNLRSGVRPSLGTLNLLVSRQVVEQVGLFDENLIRCQDIEWTLRMRTHGHKLNFYSKAVIEHFPKAVGLPQLVKLWYQTGFFSGQVRQKYREIISPPPFYKAPLFLILLSPIIGALVTLRIFIQNIHLLQYLHTMPVIYLTKVAWCVGAAVQTLRSR